MILSVRFGTCFLGQSVLESCSDHLQALKSHKMHWFISDAMFDIFRNNFSFYVTIITPAIGKTVVTS